MDRIPIIKNNTLDFLKSLLDPIQFIKKNYHAFFTLLGFLLMFFLVFYISLKLLGKNPLGFDLKVVYIALFIFPIASFMSLWGTYPYRLNKRREVDKAELVTLFAEVDRFPNADEHKIGIVQKEIERLKSLLLNDEKIFELEALGLRQELVALYPDEELLSQSRYELTLLKEYAEDDPGRYKDWKNKILGVIKYIEDEKEKEKIDEKDINAFNLKLNILRSDLIQLRETVAQYEYAWAEGEVIFKRVLYWVAGTSLVALIMGIVPITSSSCDVCLGLFHWGALGVSGGLLSILVGIQDPSIPELGETKGKQILHRTVLAVVIGGMTSILLYSTLSAGILAGGMFPKIQSPCEGACDWAQISKSIFWGIMAGFSMRIFVNLVGIAEGPFKKEKMD